jgi:hypothetical protein
MIKSLIEKVKRSLEGSASLTSKTSVSGHLRVSLVYSDREEVILDEKNLITLLGKRRLLETLYVGASNPVISTLRVGTGGTIDPEGKFPKAVTSDLTALYNQVQSIPVIYTLDQSYPSVTYIADVDPTLCNGQLISEAGLFFSDGMMFNIKTFPAIPKTVDFSIHFEWTIRIS